VLHPGGFDRCIGLYGDQIDSRRLHYGSLQNETATDIIVLADQGTFAGCGDLSILMGRVHGEIS
jgi:hypothetical protein